MHTHTHARTHTCTHTHTLTHAHMHTHLLGASVQLLTSPDNVLIRIYFQDEHTKQVFHAYSELICMDATYELLELRFPVYIMLVEDGNSQCEIVAVFLLQEETEDSIKSMIGIFKEHNPHWQATHVLMADKDMTEREVMAAEFPCANLLICLFHTFWLFRREVSVDKMVWPACYVLRNTSAIGICHY